MTSPVVVSTPNPCRSLHRGYAHRHTHAVCTLVPWITHAHLDKPAGVGAAYQVEQPLTLVFCRYSLLWRHRSKHLLAVGWCLAGCVVQTGCTAEQLSSCSCARSMLARPCRVAATGQQQHYDPPRHRCGVTAVSCRRPRASVRSLRSPQVRRPRRSTRTHPRELLHPTAGRAEALHTQHDKP